MGINLGSTTISDLKLGANPVDKAYLGSELVWQKSSPVPTLRALKFTSSGSQSLGVKTSSLGDIIPNFEYSNDGNTWTSWDVTTTLPFGNGVDLYLRGNNQTLAHSGSSCVNFVFSETNEVACTGNVMHLLDYTQDLTSFPVTENSQGFRNLFNFCNQLVSAPSLPATSLVTSCYLSMFAYCSRLVEPPKLPALELTTNCYYMMFTQCTSLNSIPALPATTLATDCYNQMFRYCSSIKMSQTQDESYPNEFAFGINPNSYANRMFSNTGGSFTSSPNQQIYYTANTIIS